MTKLLEDAILKIRELPDSDQDEVARILFELVSKRTGRVRLDDDTGRAVQRGRAQASRGKFAREEELVQGLDGSSA